jgi:hypothetical protein
LKKLNQNSPDKPAEKFLGLDIGGANIKAVLLEFKGEKISNFKSLTLYFPIWKLGKNQLPQTLNSIKSKLASSLNVRGLGLTFTAELSDVYMSKREGVAHIINSVREVFREFPIGVVNCFGELISVEKALAEPLKAASANWAASGWMTSKLFKEALTIDIGSTTTTIIPVKNGKIMVEGKNDLEKLSCGELVYTGALRTSPSAIVKEVPIRGKPTRVSSENFAITADLYLALGEISREDYTVETPDGRGKSVDEALARIARLVCADLEMLPREEVLSLADYVAEQQLKQIVEAVNQVFHRYWDEEVSKENLTVIVAGVRKGFLARKAALKAGFKKILCIDEVLGFEASRVMPAVGAAFMAAETIGGISLKS